MLFVTAALRDLAIWMSINDTAVPPSGGSLCGTYSSPPWHVGVSHVTCVQPESCLNQLIVGQHARLICSLYCYWICMLCCVTLYIRYWTAKKNQIELTKTSYL